MALKPKIELHKFEAKSDDLTFAKNEIIRDKHGKNTKTGMLIDFFFLKSWLKVNR